jgi:hypothetical protein
MFLYFSVKTLRVEPAVRGEQRPERPKSHRPKVKSLSVYGVSSVLLAFHYDIGEVCRFELS